MFYLHKSNKTENLLLQLGEVLSLAREKDPLQPEYFLVQSQGVERLLSQQLAGRFGVWCNYEYLLPTRFFELMAGKLEVEGGGQEDYSRARLHWRLEKILRNPEDDCTVIRNYISGETKEIKRYQLAGQLAYLFDQYQIMRPDMIEAWESEGMSCSSRKSAELCQMRLWNRLREDIGHSRHRGVFLADLITCFYRESVPEGVLPARVSIFGMHSMPPVFLKCLEGIARHTQVHFYLLSPCENYWGEARGVRSGFRDDYLSEGVHPLLGSLGQQGREFLEMLEDVKVAEEFSSFEDMSGSGVPTLLRKLQSDLLRGEITEVDGSLSADESLLVVSAHSPYRELMILRDRILHWFEHDSHLALKDIVVMAPEIKDYSYLVPAVFHDIPHSIADGDPALGNSFIASFLHFFQVCRSRYGWEEVLALLERRQIRSRFEIDEKDMEQIRHWVLSAGIRWGLSGGHKESMSLPADEECTWRAGLARLFMGYAVSGEDVIHGVIPGSDIEGAMAAPLGGLSLFCDVLAEARECFSHSYPLARWGEILSGFIGRLFSPGVEEEAGLLDLYRIVSDLELEYGSCSRESLRFEVIASWVETSVSEKKSSGGFLRGQLTFCSMLPMRSIPFARVCLLGLNDSEFPKNDKVLPFDLLADTVRFGDRSRRSDDRYQFLEAILAARESLYLSYVGQSIKNNDPIPPSPVVAELLELIKAYGVSDIVEHHPLHGFSARYFSAESSLFTYNENLLVVAEAAAGPGREVSRWWHGSLAEAAIKGPLALTELFSFFKNPQHYFVSNILGISGGGSERHEEREPFVLDHLENFLINQELLEIDRSGTLDLEQKLRQIQVEGRWPLGAPGEIKFRNKISELHPFMERLAVYRSARPVDDCRIELEVCGRRLEGNLSNIRENGSLLYSFVKLQGKDFLRAWLHHCLVNVCLAKGCKTRLLVCDSEITFNPDSGDMASLEYMVNLFLSATVKPSSLLTEPVMAYAVQRLKTDKSGKGDPMGQALGVYRYLLGQEYNHEWQLLYQGQEAVEVLGPDFVEICEWFYSDVYCRAQIQGY